VGKYISEFIGTFTLIFVGVGAGVANHMTNGAVGITGIALAHGLALAVMISAVAAVSGGHLNPAVTCGALAAGKIKPGIALGYWVSQFAGGVAGAAVLKLAAPADALAATNFGLPGPGSGVTTGQALIMEIVLTFFLMFVVYGTAIDARAPKVGGLFIGLTVALGIMAGAPVSGGAMNPARYLGPALMGGGLAHAWIYFVGPITGSVLAAVIYKSTIEAKA
jgi:aquaporin TIP